MKNYIVTLEGKSFNVSVNDPHANPVRVTVDGETFDVQLEPLAPPTKETAPALQAAPAAPVAARETPPASAPGNLVQAPMPGTINKISVSPGDRVERGQELCVLEAMKMNNVIRATRAGQVAQVRVALKQSVQHGDVLIVFADQP